MFSKKIKSVVFFTVLLIPLTLPSFPTSSAQSLSLIKVDEFNLNVGYSINIIDNYAYIADNDGISILDVSDPTNVVSMQNVSLPVGSLSTHIVDGIAYAACATDGFYIINVTDISDPEILAHETVNAKRVFVEGDLAFLSDYYSGLTILNISDKNNPVEESFYHQSGDIWATVAKGDVAYIANPAIGIEVLNVTEPSTPVRISVISSVSGGTHMSINEDKLYVGKHGNGLAILDISIPSNPILLGSYNDYDDGEELGLRGNNTHLAVADNFGIELFNITNLPSISKIAEYRDNVGAAHDVEIIDNYIFAVDGYTGFFVLEITDQTTPSDTGMNFGIYSFLSLLVLISTKIVLNQRKIK